MNDTCFHCNDPIPENLNLTVEYQGDRKPVCCVGCQSVAQLILNGGLSAYYAHRDAPAERPDRVADDSAVFDDAAFQAAFCQPCQGSLVEASLLVDGINCAACAWLIERHLGAIDGVDQVRVNVARKRLVLRFNVKSVKLSRIVSSLSDIGYQVSPWSETSLEALSAEQGKRLLFKLGLAGIAFLQVMMFAVALYAGDYSGIDASHQSLMRWFSLAISVPVVLYSASPFFIGALSAFKARSLTMDVPIAVAIALAWSASIWATVTRSGEVYYDSVVMFTFFLLAGRYLEHLALHKEHGERGRLSSWLPDRAYHQERGWVPALSIVVGDVVRVSAGDPFPADGMIISGQTHADESLLTGEHKPIAKSLHDEVLAGTVNVDSVVEVQVTATGEQCGAGRIHQLLVDAMDAKPPITQLVDRISGWFVGSILLIASVTYWVWYQTEPNHALWVALSVLVVTCPCALSLATPVALTSSVHGYRDRNILVSNTSAIPELGGIQTVIFDKTGTLTLGRPSVVRVNNLSAFDSDYLFSVAAGLEAFSNHPIAKAFNAASPIPFASAEVVVGKGVEGRLEDDHWQIGRPLWLDSSSNSTADVALARNGVILIEYFLEDEIRQGGRDAIEQLKSLGVEVKLASGDKLDSVTTTATYLGIEDFKSECTPEEKYQWLLSLQKMGRRVMMVGDGLNDVPVIGAANVSVAMASGAGLARCHADVIVMDERLDAFPEMIRFARRTQQKIIQNLAWALGYNALALPLAVMGFVPPWAAAIGMSASSLVVVLNALRLSR